jgi:Ribbon-helix-helix protein, copG family.
MTGTTATEKIEDVPNQPKTPARAVRIDDVLWDAVRQEAERRGENASDVVRRALREHLRMPQAVTE